MPKPKSPAGQPRPVWEKTAHKGAVYAVAFSPTGKYLASGGHDATARMWRVADGEQVAVERERKPLWAVTGLAFGPGGAELVLVTAGGTRQADGQFRVYGWDLVGREVTPLGGAAGVRFQLGAPAVSPTGDAVAVSGRTIDWYAGGKWESRAVPSAGRCEAVAFSPGGKYLAAAGGDGVIRVLGVKSRKAVREWAAHDGAAAALVVSTDGKRLASAGTGGGIGLWDFTTGGRVRVWETGRAPALSVGFLPGGRLASFHALEDKAAVQVWSADADEPVSKLALGDVQAVALSADGRLLATAGQDGAVSVWETAGLLPRK